MFLRSIRIPEGIWERVTGNRELKGNIGRRYCLKRMNVLLYIKGIKTKCRFAGLDKTGIVQICRSLLAAGCQKGTGKGERGTASVAEDVPGDLRGIR